MGATYVSREAELDRHRLDHQGPRARGKVIAYDREDPGHVALVIRTVDAERADDFVQGSNFRLKAATNTKKFSRLVLTVPAHAFLFAWLLLLVNGTVAADGAGEGKPTELPIFQQWRGDYPVSEFHRLPEGQRATHVGYLNSTERLIEIWQVFKPRHDVPQIDFNAHIVIFARNVNFYNRTAIAKIMLRDGIAEILAMETMSTQPIEDYVAMALAVIPRKAVTAIQAGIERIPVTSNTHRSAADPLNATYTIQGKSIALHKGQSEIQISPDAATRMRTFVSGKPVDADLDRDGDADAVLILVHDPGGSGTFYYVAAALNDNGRYQGTDAVLLGDRIVPGDVTVREGIVEINYFDRASDAPMSSDPSIAKQRYLIIDNGTLKILPTLGNHEQVFQGWVTIGSEVRTVRPCLLGSRNLDSTDEHAR